MNIALTSYRRPELTEKCLNSLLQLEGVSGIYVIIDGLRPSSDLQEARWREETIRVSERIAHTNSKVSVKVWERNIGVEENAGRSFAPLFETNQNLIITEEDVELNQMAFNFLTRVAQENHEVLATSYSQSTHVNVGVNDRTTLFPQLWGAMYSREVFERSLKVRRDSVISGKIVEECIKNIFPVASPYRLRLINHWMWYFNYALKTHRHPDVLLQYASWTMDIFAIAPVIPLSKDISGLDTRGMNIRHTIPDLRTHCNSITQANGFRICKQCEKESCRIESNSIKHYAKGFYRKIQQDN